MPRYIVVLGLCGAAALLIVFLQSSANALPSARTQVFELSPELCRDQDTFSTLEKISSFLQIQGEKRGTDLAFLADNDQFYLGIRLRSCNSGSLRPEHASVIQCLREASDNELETFRTKAKTEALLTNIKDSGYINAKLAERFPRDFLGISGTTCGLISFPDVPSTQSATIKDCRYGAVYPLEYTPPDEILRNFILAHPSFQGWVEGQYILINGKLTFELKNIP